MYKQTQTIMKYLLITLRVQDGEREHTHRCLETTNAKNIHFAAERFASKYWGYGEREDDYWWFFGEIIVQLYSVVEVTEFEYNLMSRLFSGQKQENYFEIVHAGYQPELEREEIQIHGGENGNVFLIKTDQGFVVDVYGQDDLVNSMVIWEDDLSPTTEKLDKDDNDNCLYCGEKCWEGEMCDEQQAGGFNSPFLKGEIEDFKNEWGQTHDEICSNLGYDTSGSDDLLMVDYFWVHADEKWYPKASSMYSEREQAIADHLRTNL